ncbi:9883_t:CDS:1, partial [Racocetra fulgida]
MFYAISLLASDLVSNDNILEIINFNSNVTALDDNITYENPDEEIDDVTTGAQRIKINTYQN